MPPPPEDSASALVRRLSLFANVPGAVVDRFMAQAHWRTYEAGEIVVDSGDTTNDVFFIAQGAVRVAVRTAFGYEAILNDLHAGDFFGELAAIDGLRRSANVTALLCTRLYVVPAAAFMELALSSPDVSMRLLRLLSTRLRTKDERLIEFSALTARQRMIAELLRLSRDRGCGERIVSPPLVQHVLAARIGTRRETVSREMANLSRAGLLTLSPRGIILHKPEMLRAEVEACLQGSDGSTLHSGLPATSGHRGSATASPAANPVARRLNGSPVDQSAIVLSGPTAHRSRETMAGAVSPLAT